MVPPVKWDSGNPTHSRQPLQGQTKDTLSALGPSALLESTNQELNFSSSDTMLALEPTPRSREIGGDGSSSVITVEMKKLVTLLSGAQLT